MKRQSLSAIERSYTNQGYQGARLRQALERDYGYQALLAERRQRLARQFSITPSERKRYVLSTEQDFAILALCKRLARQKLTAQERTLVRLIRTQLEHDWRAPLLKALRNVARKYHMDARNN